MKNKKTTQEVVETLFAYLQHKPDCQFLKNPPVITCTCGLKAAEDAFFSEIRILRDQVKELDKRMRNLREDIRRNGY